MSEIVTESNFIIYGNGITYSGLVFEEDNYADFQYENTDDVSQTVDNTGKYHTHIRDITGTKGHCSLMVYVGSDWYNFLIASKKAHTPVLINKKQKNNLAVIDILENGFVQNPEMGDYSNNVQTATFKVIGKYIKF